ncbi:hypothetical protein PSI19_03290 [Xenorhabdus khoisanae]|uniref:hypothetical protein n=1 Tax=Xenorhabdus khoisanae TaxID=880157 RepID=UPI00235A2C01|nr:hypothetical protein [Xenorhabdus khoisanae]MDC9612922.1 hypothetical protein [Xenorhabdus khoisanae]
MTNSDLCRAAFENFLLTKLRYFENEYALEKNGDGTYLNMSSQNYLEVFQTGWKASREIIEIELPKNFIISEIENKEPDIQERMIARNETINDIWEMLERQGLKVKENQNEK